MSRTRPDPGRALGRLVAAVGEYARLRTRQALGATLKRVTDEAAITLPADLRQQIDRAVSGQGQATALLKWITLLAESRKVLEADLEARGARLRESVRRSGALIDGRILEKALAAVGEVGSSLADLGALLDRRRAVTLVQAEIERREEEIRLRWRKARETAQTVIGQEAVQAADAGLASEDLLPVAEALDEIDARSSGEADAPDPLSKARADLVRALDASQDFLAPRERDWVRRALSICPAGNASVGEAALSSWVSTLGEIGRGLESLVAARQQTVARLEECLGDAGTPPVGAGYERLSLLIEALGQKRCAAEARREMAGRQLLEAEYDLSRAIWEDGAWASASALREGRQAFLECHRARELQDEETVLSAGRRIAGAAARVRTEASWRRRWLLRHGKAGQGEREREAARLGERLKAQLQKAGDEEVESRCRETEAGLRASLAALCARLGDAGEGQDGPAGRARIALEYGEPTDLDRVLHELRG